MKEPDAEVQRGTPMESPEKSKLLSPRMSPKKVVIRGLASRHRSRKTSTPLPASKSGSGKRAPLSPIPENSHVRKKILFDTSEIRPSGRLGNRAQGGIAGDEDHQCLEELQGLVGVGLLQFCVGVTDDGNMADETRQLLSPAAAETGTVMDEVAVMDQSSSQVVNSELVSDETSQTVVSNLNVPVIQLSQTVEQSEACAPIFNFGEQMVGHIVVPALNDTIVEPQGEEPRPDTKESMEFTAQILSLPDAEKDVNVCLPPINKVGTAKHRKKRMGNSQKWKGFLANVGGEGAPRSFFLQPPSSASIPAVASKIHMAVLSPTGAPRGAEDVRCADAAPAVASFVEKLKEGLGAATSPTSPPQSVTKEGSKSETPLNPLFRAGAATSLGSRAPEPVPFDPNKVKDLGVAGVCQGIPSISFSTSDTEFLAGKLGHAMIVGKFSHSIPSSHHIQKALGNLKFVGSFSWKHMNAKHIFLQFGDPSDYARMLNGPNGAPVWYVDRHPMRVFKWTPDFDPFFESPIAAIWCNLIGLPIHLYEHSALFAIGSLLGKPIQADHATATKSRLSYARICVEIDISVPPPEEIVLDLLGKEVRQKVTWDRIPLYCCDCKHVGHVKESCYAFGKKTMPEKKDYTLASIPRHPSHAPRPKRQVWQPRKSDGGVSTSNVFAVLARRDEAEKEFAATGTTHPANPFRGNLDGDGFHRVEKRRGKQSNRISPMRQGSGVDDVSAMMSVDDKKGSEDSRQSTKPASEWGLTPYWDEGSSFHSTRDIIKPQFYKQLANGDFDTEETEEEMVMEVSAPGGEVVELPPGG